ncbi:uncharacterized protein LOC132601789 [Lycium barbarum]|uniref:uncharacterized protein LOC132601789 n=1 Tax=Lycium barbarum TaxID=112863 RepID=UPI00293ED77E|nr:uncharacterized protein LOC132601789 [Lycium barbarum]
MKEDERDKEIRELREEVRNMRISKRGEKLECEDLCVHPDVDLPDGYKPSKFEMFDGTGNPRNHLRSYCDKLAGVGRNPTIRMKLFIRSLTGDALTWYTEQDPKKWHNWSSMAKDFMERFRFNIEIVPDRSYLERVKKKTTETFREYAIRWRSEAARVRPPMDESEMTDIFIKAQDNMYYERMLLMTGEKFTDLVKIGEALEEGIKSGRVTNFAALQETTKDIQSGTIGGSKKKREEVAAVMNIQERGPSQIHAYHNPYSQMFSPISYPVYNTQPAYYQQTSARYQPQNNLATPPRPRQNFEKKKTYTPLAEPYAQLFERLKAAGVIHPIPWRNIEPRPKWFDETKHCAYHSGAAGHDTESCLALKDKIELLIKENVIQLKGASPNVTNNPLPNHGDVGVNMITTEDDWSLKGTIVPVGKEEKTKFDLGHGPTSEKGFDSKKKGDIYVLNSNPPTAKMPEDAAEDSPVEGVKTLFVAKEAIENCTETPSFKFKIASNWQVVLN